MSEKYKVVCFLAREHGLNGLEYLINSDKYQVVCVFTHKRNPKSMDPKKAVRPEFIDFIQMTEANNIPLHTVDFKNEKYLIDDVLDGLGEFDLIACISWRMIIPVKHLALAKRQGVNLHRGKLPDYPGSEPIKQALNNSGDFITITSHLLTEVIDAGEPLEHYHHKVNYVNTVSQYDNIERLKKELTPYFGPLLIRSFDKITRNPQGQFSE